MLPARLPSPTTSPSSTATSKTLSGASCALGLNGRGNTFRAEREVIGLSAHGFQAGEQRLCVFTVRFSDNKVIVRHACSPLDVFLAAMILLEKDGNTMMLVWARGVYARLGIWANREVPWIG